MPRGSAAALQDGEHVHVAALAEPDANGERWETVKVVLMHVSERGVPLDSRLEGRVEDRTPSIPLEVFARDTSGSAAAVSADVLSKRVDS